MNKSMIYLKKMSDGSVKAFGDEESASKFGNYDMVITQEEWNSCGNIARVVDEKIVLGYTDEENREYNENVIRMERSFRLIGCDKMNPMRWNSLSDEKKAEWTAYRQALLDITSQPGFPWDGDIKLAPWPTFPKD